MEGRNVAIEVRWAAGRSERFAETQPNWSVNVGVILTHTTAGLAASRRHRSSRSCATAGAPGRQRPRSRHWLDRAAMLPTHPARLILSASGSTAPRDGPRISPIATLPCRQRLCRAGAKRGSTTARTGLEVVTFEIGEPKILPRLRGAPGPCRCSLCRSRPDHERQRLHQYLAQAPDCRRCTLFENSSKPAV
jgi:hypothetical protein